MDITDSYRPQQHRFPAGNVLCIFASKVSRLLLHNDFSLFCSKNQAQLSVHLQSICFKTYLYVFLIVCVLYVSRNHRPNRDIFYGGQTKPTKGRNNSFGSQRNPLINGTIQLLREANKPSNGTTQFLREAKKLSSGTKTLLRESKQLYRESNKPSTEEQNKLDMPYLVDLAKISHRTQNYLCKQYKQLRIAINAFMKVVPQVLNIIECSI